MGYLLGVDVGTTFSAAAIVRDGRAEILPLGNQAHAIPSAVYLRPDGEALVGEAALRRAASDPDGLAREFKRRFGDPTPLFVRGEAVTPEVLTGRVLQWIVATATEREAAAPERVVLTCPASWGGYRRELLDDAARLAGIDQVMVVTEPEAAAAHYASQERVPAGAYVAVYDLGGGTFDATVLRSTNGGFEICGSPEGIDHLGGVDFDEAVFEAVVAASGLDPSTMDVQDPGVLRGMLRLRADCTAAKEDLSNQDDTLVTVGIGGVDTTVTLKRADFEAMISPLVAETVAALERAVASAEIDAADLHAVLLVGGSSRIPLVARVVGEATGRPLAIDTHPKYTVALGAVASATASRHAAAPAVSARQHTARSEPGVAERLRGWAAAAVAGPRRWILAVGVAAIALLVALTVVAPSERSAGGGAESTSGLPDLTGQRQDAALAELAGLGLLHEVELVTSAGEAGIVVNQLPGAGTALPTERVVTLQISAAPPDVTVPDVRGQARAEAVAALEELGLDVSVTLQRDENPGEAVVATSPPAGEVVPEGFRIEVTVATNETSVAMPDLVNRPYQEAIDEAERLGLDPRPRGRIDVQGAAGTVVATAPEAGVLVDATGNREVTLEVAVVPAPGSGET